MTVKINIPPNFQYFTDNAETVEVNGRSVIECLQILVERFPGLETILFDESDVFRDDPLNFVAIFLNGIHVRPEELSSQVNDGDELELVYVILGG
jgi:molybdopterin converting factor small subunit